MSVLVDTSVWSLAFRRRDPVSHPAVAELRGLIWETRACLIGPVRQELLSGIREPSQFQKLRQHLGAFPDLGLSTPDYERAAEFFNLCRARGVQGSNTDFLLCAAAERHGVPILTTDGDFPIYARHLPIELYRPDGVS
jgi:predicted nucleic acid-binding protein